MTLPQLIKRRRGDLGLSKKDVVTGMGYMNMSGGCGWYRNPGAPGFSGMSRRSISKLEELKGHKH